MGNLHHSIGIRIANVDVPCHQNRCHCDEEEQRQLREIVNLEDLDWLRPEVKEAVSVEYGFGFALSLDAMAFGHGKVTRGSQ